MSPGSCCRDVLAWVSHPRHCACELGARHPLFSLQTMAATTLGQSLRGLAEARGWPKASGQEPVQGGLRTRDKGQEGQWDCSDLRGMSQGGRQKPDARRRRGEISRAEY